MLDYVRERTIAPFEPQYPDADCLYADRRILDLDKMEPLVALPGKVLNTAAGVSEVRQGADCIRLASAPAPTVPLTISSSGPNGRGWDQPLYAS